MAKALEYPIVFKALLNGGHICCVIFTDGRCKYTVHVPDKSVAVGHITDKQYKALILNNVIAELAPQQKDNYGNIYHYYNLRI